MKPKFALVQWVGGDYDQTYTAGIPVEWILDFDVDKFNPAEEPEDHSYTIEWRESKSGKMPKRGWKYYDAKVVRVSRRIKSLEDQIKILDGVVSPWRPATVEKDSEHPVGINLESLYDTFEDEEEVALNSTSTPKETKKTKKRKGNGYNNEMETDLGDESQKKKKKKKNKSSDQEFSNQQKEDDSILQFLNTSSHREGRLAETNLGFVYDANDFIQKDGQVPSTSTATSVAQTRKKSKTGYNKEPEADHGEKGRKQTERDKKSSERDSDDQQSETESIPEPPETPSNLGDNQSLKQILLKLCQDIKLVKQVQLDMLRNQNPPAQRRNAPADHVEIGHPGSNVFVTQRQWNAADAQTSYTTMGVSLVRALFDDDVLMASNLRGGLSKINKNAPRRPGLNSVIVAAIEEAVRNKFPDFKRGHFGAQINNMMNDLRKKNKAGTDDNEEPED